MYVSKLKVLNDTVFYSIEMEKAKAHIHALAARWLH